MLDVVEVPRPAAGPGQVVVAVVTAATNPGEIGIREGHFAAVWPAHFPEGQGNDFVHSDAQEKADTPRIWAELAHLVARNDITVPIAAVYDFTTEQVRQAYRDVGTRHVSGKRVVRIMPAHHQARHT